MIGAWRAVAWALLAGLSLPACSSCPPSWAESVRAEPGFTYAAASCGEVFVDADATGLALTRAARRLADALGLDVEQRLAVRLSDERLFVEAVGPSGPLTALDDLELVDLRVCDGRTHALVRLPVR